MQNGETLTRSQLIARLKSDDFNYEYAADTKTEETLADNDSYNALKVVDGLIMTGPTGTNVNDISVILIC